MMPTIYDDLVHTEASKRVSFQNQILEDRIKDYLIKISKFGWIAHKDKLHLFHFSMRSKWAEDTITISYTTAGAFGVSNVFENTFKIVFTDFADFALESPIIKTGQNQSWEKLFDDLYKLDRICFENIVEFLVGNGWVQRPDGKDYSNENYEGLKCVVCGSPMLKWQGHKVCSLTCRKKRNSEKGREIYSGTFGHRPKREKLVCDICGDTNKVYMFNKERPLCRKHFQSEYRKLRKLEGK